MLDRDHPEISGEIVAEFLRRLAPRDLDGPIYCYLASEGVPAEFIPSDDDTLAAYSPSLDLALNPWLVESGQWRGRGPAIVLCEERIADDSDCSLNTPLEALTAVAIHELAHALDRPPAEASPITADIEAAETIAAGLCALPAGTFTPSRPWVGHDGRFVRVLCHLAHRAEQMIGFALPEVYLLDAESYGLSPLGAYRECLGSELGRLEGRSFQFIKNLRPPELFCELWKRDVRDWFSGSPEADADDALREIAMFDDLTPSLPARGGELIA